LIKDGQIELLFCLMLLTGWFCYIFASIFYSKGLYKF
jgi:hypothetical protein